MNLMISAGITALSVLFTPAAVADTVLSLSDLMQIGVPYSNLVSPDALQTDDVERWAAIIGASNEQAEFMRIRFPDFLQQHNSLLNTVGSRYLAQSATVAKLQSAHPPDFELCFRAMQALRRDERHFQQQLERVENEYIDSFLSVLTDEQVDRLYLLRFEASRRQSRCFPLLYPLANVDLRILWAGHSEWMPQDEAASVNEVLNDYESRITPLLRQTSTYWTSAALEMSKLFWMWRSGQMNDDQFKDKYHAIWNKAADAARSAQIVTRQTISQIESAVAPATARKLVAAAKRAAFPEAYPDRSSIFKLFDFVQNSVDLNLTDQQRSHVLELHAAYGAEYEAVCSEFENLYIEWSDRGMRGAAGYEPQSLHTALQPLLLKRTSISSKWAAILKEAVGEDIAALQSERTHEPEWPSPEQIKRATSAGKLKPKRPPIPRSVIAPPRTPQPIPGR